MQRALASHNYPTTWNTKGITDWNGRGKSQTGELEWPHHCRTIETACKTGCFPTDNTTQCTIRLSTRHTHLVTTSKEKRKTNNLATKWTLTPRHFADYATLTHYSRGAATIRLDMWTNKNDCTKFISLNVSTSFLRDHFGSVKLMKDAVMRAFSETYLSRNGQN